VIKHCEGYGRLEALPKCNRLRSIRKSQRVILLLPFALVASRYSISFLIVASVGFFALTFIDALFYLAAWMDDNLIASFMSSPDSLVGRENGGAFFLLNILISSLYFILPALFGLVMAWAGFTVAGAVNGALTTGSAAPGGANSASNSAGSTATQLPGSIARGAEGAGSVAAAAGNRAANAARSSITNQLKGYALKLICNARSIFYMDQVLTISKKIYIIIKVCLMFLKCTIVFCT